MRHFCVIIVNRIETGLVFQAKNKDDRVHPWGKLERKKKATKNIKILIQFKRNLEYQANICPNKYPYKGD